MNNKFKGGYLMKNERKQYEAPEVITYSEDEIVEIVGPGPDLLTKPVPDISIILNINNNIKKYPRKSNYKTIIKRAVSDL